MVDALSANAVAFPANDWLAFPDGDQYLAAVNGSAQLRGELAALRQRHVDAVNALLNAIARDRVEVYRGAVQMSAVNADVR